MEKISADFPLTITVGVKGETITFETSDQYFDWLQESREAAYKWSSCVDVMGVSKMTQLDIDIIVHEEGKEPFLNVFKTVAKFPWKSDDKMRPTFAKKEIQGKMTVLNWKNTHFNLIVGPEHMLLQVGSISFQSAISTASNTCTAPCTETGATVGRRAREEEGSPVKVFMLNRIKQMNYFLKMKQEKSAMTLKRKMSQMKLH